MKIDMKTVLVFEINTKTITMEVDSLVVPRVLFRGLDGLKASMEHKITSTIHDIGKCCRRAMMTVPKSRRYVCKDFRLRHPSSDTVITKTYCSTQLKAYCLFAIEYRHIFDAEVSEKLYDQDTSQIIEFLTAWWFDILISSCTRVLASWENEGEFYYYVPGFHREYCYKAVEDPEHPEEDEDNPGFILVPAGKITKLRAPEDFSLFSDFDDIINKCEIIWTPEI